MLKLLRVVAILATASYCSPYEFQPDFMFGVASASYQVEGGWNASGKGESIWDRFTHEHPDWIIDGSNGDIACDSYNKIAEDVEILKELGVDFYRFSLSWSRILPKGQTNIINPDGIRYYNELIDTLLANGIQSYVTLYHWDLPQALQELGGWVNPYMIQYYEDYADLVFRTFGDRVKVWITFNEPIEVCKTGYGEGRFAPAMTQSAIGDYLCGKTLLLAHARAYHLYHEKYQADQNGVVGWAVSTPWAEPKTDSPGDIEAAERKMWLEYGWFTYPIFSETGNYPPVMIDRIAAVSAAENFPRSRLPPLSQEEIDYIKGTSDFLGLNHYSTWIVSEVDYNMSAPSSFWKDIGVMSETDPAWGNSSLPWLKVVPWGMRKLLNWIKDIYNNPPVYITENGFADVGEVDDLGRVLRIPNVQWCTSCSQQYLNALLDAINIDGCNVKAYAAWSIMDNFEWKEGYTAKFGLYQVNFDDPSRPRSPKSSGFFYKNVISSRTVPDK